MLDEFGVAHEVRVLSAHRTPRKVEQFARRAESRGIEVLIAAAGGAAHLAGVCAAWTRLPVIGVPMATAQLGGLDSLLSTVQMPAGVPVATVAIGDGGARNAAHLAVRILAGRDPALRKRLEAAIAKQEKTVLEKDRALAGKIRSAKSSKKV